jgi:hypothetical protein
MKVRDAHDELLKASRVFIRTINECLIKNIEADKTLQIEPRTLHRLLQVIKLSIDEGHHIGSVTFQQRLEEVVPPNNVPLIMERIPGRRR